MKLETKNIKKKLSITASKALEIKRFIDDNRVEMAKKSKTLLRLLNSLQASLSETNEAFWNSAEEFPGDLIEPGGVWFEEYDLIDRGLPFNVEDYGAALDELAKIDTRGISKWVEELRTIELAEEVEEPWYEDDD